MKRIEKAYIDYPDGVVIEKDNGLMKNSNIEDFCPYDLDCSEDVLDENTKVGEYGNIKGCRGITCEQCWDKEFTEVTN